MRAAGVPVLPDSTVEGADDPDAVGYPMLVKASAGGGGRGMRIVRSPAELADARAAAEREAAAAFGDGTVFCERYVERGRHVEIQVFADTHGHVVSLHERECSIQRRHQKIVEEAPSPAVDAELRAPHGRGRRRGRPHRRLRRRRHRRVPARPRRHVLVPRDEHPPAGRAPGDRGDHRARPRRAPAARGRGRPAAAGGAGAATRRPRHRGPPHRRGPGRRLPPLDGHVQPPSRSTAPASTPASSRGRPSRRTTTRWSPRSSPTDRPGPPPSARSAARCGRPGCTDRSPTATSSCASSTTRPSPAGDLHTGFLDEDRTRRPAHR